MYARGNISISAHSSSWRGELCACAVRYDHSSFSTIADILTLVQIWSTSTLQRESDQLWDAIVIMKAAYAEVSWVLLFNRIPSQGSNLSAPHRRTLHAVAILVFALLVRGHVWLESGAGMFFI